jgi:hypothetical protein
MGSKAIEGAPRTRHLVWRTAYAVGLTIGLASCSGASQHSATPDYRLNLERKIGLLEQRRAALQDINDIKRLQRAYGYYVDAGLWDQVADLFAENGTVEFGLDGVYRGKGRVRQYFYALGGGKTGLSPGQVSENFQLMPVIDLGPDGRTAKGTWRSVILTGKLGTNAYWGEGPYENEYVKENGVWKISTLHWYQTLVVPYAGGGWTKQKDVNGGKYVSGRLPPDSPPTVAYETWPATFVPPFHFKDKTPGPVGVGAGAAGVEPGAVIDRSTPKDSTPQALQSRLIALDQQVRLLEDQHLIENLQRIYGYYIDKGMWTEAADLFADDGQVEVAGRGAYVGKARVLAYLRAIGPEGPQEGRLFDNMQLQPVVYVDPRGKTAKARWHLFAQHAEWKKFAEWGAGVYENEYVNQGGVWKIQRLRLYGSMYSPYEDGWGKSRHDHSSFEPSLPPDRAAMSSSPRVAPFDYENPVTGAHSHGGATRRVATNTTAAHAEVTEESLAELDHRIGLLEDESQIENIHAMYGYYLATFEWDALTNLFATDGTIEIALRGVYAGRASVRRNLNLYGQQGLDAGVLHNHMQYQPVIDVAPDRQTARMRSRAFSMMGEFGKTGMWMGGIYENEFVKVDGVWRIKSDHVVNTYFSPYDVGWKEAVPRPAPGISPTNPPDGPPSMHFEMYPRPFLPPFHYDNPVTGKP